MTPGDPPRRPPAPHAPPPPPPPRYNASDQLHKNILRVALSCASTTTETEVEVLAASQKVDVYTVPDPARAAERKKMGLLGELTVEPSLIEPFSGTPGLRPIRRVICKQLTWHHELERRVQVEAAAQAAARAAGENEPAAEAPQVIPFPWLLVISQGRPATVLEVYGCKQIRDGVYEAVPGLRMRIVVLAELPRTRETLLLRLLGSGRVLKDALADLWALPADAWEKSIATPLLVEFRLGQVEQATNEEDAVGAAIWMGVEEYEQKLRAEGRGEGRTETRAGDVLTVLRARGIAVPDAVRERILAQKDPEQLERWLAKAAVVASIAEVIDEPS
jgi:hypothetical protein